MAFPFEGYEVPENLRPHPDNYRFDLAGVLNSVVALEAEIPADAFTVGTLGAERLGNGIVLNGDGLILTIGYLITEAARITLTTHDGRRVRARALGVDAVTGFGLAQAEAPLGLEPVAMGDSRKLGDGTPVVVVGAGGTAHALEALVLSRMTFAGYWEYLLDESIMTEPAHPHWSGAALISLKGQLLGVGSLALQRQSRTGPRPINMFVPISLLPPILDDLANGRRPFPPRPWLGVMAHEAKPNIVVVGVSPGGPASRAELRAGDQILAVADTPVSDLAEFYTRLWAQGPAGANIPLRLRREGDVFDVTVRSADRAALLKWPKPS